MKNVLITGVSSGTGLGLTEKFLAQGFQVVGSLRTEEKAAALRSRYGEAFVPLLFDITRPDEVEAAAATLKKEFGIQHLSAIINNAGSTSIGPLLHVPLDEFRHELDVLVVGQLCVIQNFFRFLLPQESGRPAGKIFNITSISGVGVNPMFGAYAAGKHALEGLSKTLRKEIEPYGIKVTVVAPGNIATAIWDKQTDDLIEKYRGTDYYDRLKNMMPWIRSGIAKEAMSIEEFSAAFFDVFSNGAADRYTIVRSRNRRLPFSKEKVRIFSK